MFFIILDWFFCQEKIWVSVSRFKRDEGASFAAVVDFFNIFLIEMRAFARHVAPACGRSPHERAVRADARGLGRQLNLAAWGRHGRLGPGLPLVVVMQASERPLKKRLAHTLASESEISRPAKFAPNQAQWSSIGSNCVNWILPPVPCASID